MPRTIPCRRCLNAMSRWDGQGAKPSSCENPKGSRICSRCKNANKGPCAYKATDDLKVRGLELTRILAETTERSDTVKEAQWVVYRLLRVNSNKLRPAPEKETAATVVHAAVEAEPAAEQEKREILALKSKVQALERKLLVLECTAVTIEAANEITKTAAGLLHSIDQRLAELSKSFN
ncbi:hypothetical protein FHL15_011338 [Xylaria flabelliformis]|uniref:Uncharacterized protein n=1 Tax=Xylaria flabelliformis TaxID=2512241 RepID=A0A553HII6_9PEZI|nr:hypothetical protein FHL15_011338 [Xylaria flabelliformis]